ncbi:MAG: tripartite tricarboxylate transporter substrate binding protein [Sulfuricaulis sp.]|nr:tripartite tricarboxylate transporter substrate binding protein [Sulfuricaulis sp.]
MTYFRRLLAMLVLTSVTLTAAQAQAVNSGTIRIIVPSPPGSSSDLGARLIGEKLQHVLGQPVVVDNKPGADGILAAQAAAQAPADGRTLFMGTTTTHVANAVLRRKLPYDPVRDFAPVTMTATTALVLLVNSALPVNTVAELVAYAKANPGKLSVASGYVSARMAAEMFNQAAGIDLLQVPYKGATAAMTDVVGGQVQVMFGDLWGAQAFLKSGKLRALAVTTPQRTLTAPNVPTMAESGMPGYEMIAWGAFFVRAGTPAPVIARLNAELVAIIGSPEVRQRMLDAGSEVKPGTPQALGKMIVDDIAKWRRLAEVAHLEISD